ncbi:hypothetical protein V9L05_22340 (plasmid) [Bernardetia sp. Wsw4-3y2]|uniref:hypothetical protein n=1 Tax=Bernardetia sp. Wsw4-3y2 TaxID=3127471 RepID=UPI0030CD4365
MPQNPTSNKFSSIVGFLLLIGVIGFTVFINFFVEKPVEEIKEEEEIIETAEPEFSILDSADLADLWKLEKLQTDSINFHYEKLRKHIQINKNFGYITTELINNSNNLEPNTKRRLQEAYNNFDQGKVIINYGMLDFEYSYPTSYTTKLEEFDIKESDSSYYYQLKEIGVLFLKYQIKSIFTESKAGDFTKIELKDGRQLFLIKQNAEIKTEYSKKLIERAEYLNDSTKVIYPY